MHVHRRKTKKIFDKLLLAKKITLGETLMTKRQSDNNKHLPTFPVVLVTSLQLYCLDSSWKCLLLFLAVTPDIKISIHSKIIVFEKGCKRNVETASLRVGHSQTTPVLVFIHCLQKPEQQQQQQQRQRLIIPKQRRGKINCDLNREKWSFLFSFDMSLISSALTQIALFSKVANFPKHLYFLKPGTLEVCETSGLNLQFSGSSGNYYYQLCVLYIQH